MKTSSHGRLERLDATLTAAMEAAVQRATRQAEQVIMTARLATAVHLGRAAESAAAEGGVSTLCAVPSSPAASVHSTDAAASARGGGPR